MVNWNSKLANVTEFGKFQIQKVPYPSLNLITKAGKPMPRDHFPEIVVFLRNYVVEKSVFIQEASSYLALLIGAATENEVKIVLSSYVYNKVEITKNFAINSIVKKLEESKDREEDSRYKNNAELIVTTGSDLSKFPEDKPVLFIVDEKRYNPGKNIYKLSSVPICSKLELYAYTPD